MAQSRLYCGIMKSSAFAPQATWALPLEAEHWSLTTLREKLAKTGAKVVSHGGGM